MKIASGVEILEISRDVMGTPTIIHPTLLWDCDTVILVDTGYPGQLPQIREAMEKIGVPFVKLSKLIITHHDIDHIGSLSSILKELPKGVEVLAHEEEKPYIQAEKRPTKMAQMEAQMNLLPEEQRQKIKVVYEYLQANSQNLKANVDKTVTDGEELPYCGGITVIYTPGHTPGHISLYLKQIKTLITGDVMLVEGGLLVSAPQFINFDMDSAVKSLKKLTQYDIETVICYHGGVYNNNVNQRIAELVNGE